MRNCSFFIYTIITQIGQKQFDFKLNLLNSSSNILRSPTWVDYYCGALTHILTNDITLHNVHFTNYVFWNYFLLMSFTRKSLLIESNLSTTVDKWKLAKTWKKAVKLRRTSVKAVQSNLLLNETLALWKLTNNVMVIFICLISGWGINFLHKCHFLIEFCLGRRQI